MLQRSFSYISERAHHKVAVKLKTWMENRLLLFGFNYPPFPRSHFLLNPPPFKCFTPKTLYLNSETPNPLLQFCSPMFGEDCLHMFEWRMLAPGASGASEAPGPSMAQMHAGPVWTLQLMGASVSTWQQDQTTWRSRFVLFFPSSSTNICSLWFSPKTSFFLAQLLIMLFMPMIDEHKWFSFLEVDLSSGCFSSLLVESKTNKQNQICERLNLQ